MRFHKVVILLIVFISLSRIVIAQGIETSFNGEELLIKLNIPQGFLLEIIDSNNNIYRYMSNGEVNKTISFYPQEDGVYNLLVYNKFHELIHNESVMIKKDSNEGLITLNKKEFFIDEPVRITINTDIDGKVLEISNGRDIYRAILDKNELIFYPQTLGEHNVSLLSQGRLISKTSFIVKQRFKPRPLDFFSDRIINVSKSIDRIPSIRISDGKRQISAIVSPVKQNNPLGILSNALGVSNTELEIVPLTTKRLVKIYLNGVGKSAGEIEINPKPFINKELIKKYLNNRVVMDSLVIDTRNTSMSNGVLRKISTGDLILVIENNKIIESRRVRIGESYNITLSRERLTIVELGVSTINTEHPLYYPDQEVRGFITVLDKNGYPAFSANVTLTITDPLNNSFVFTYPGDIEKIKRGVYMFRFTPRNVGKYYLHVDAIGVNVFNSMDSWFIVNSSFAFDITRKMPFSINPWKGSFTSIINVSPQFDWLMNKPYSLIEVLPRNFDVVNTNGHVYKYNDSIHIVWRLINESVVNYSVQAPLETPVVYSFKSFILYGDNEEETMFNEARPWLVALDPAAKICNESPCIVPSSLIECRDSISGGVEPNQPNTIDACSDGTSGTCHSDESVENITIESLNHSVFRAGDTVRVNITVYCWDSSSDNINIAYTNDSITPSWRVVDFTDPCPAAGFNTFSYTFKLDNVVGNHTIRGIIQYNGDTSTTCGGGNYDDNDDVTIVVYSKDASPPSINNVTLNDTTIPKEGSVRLIVNATDDYGIDKVLATFMYPNGSRINKTLTAFGSLLYDNSGDLETSEQEFKALGEPNVSNVGILYDDFESAGVLTGWTKNPNDSTNDWTEDSGSNCYGGSGYCAYTIGDGTSSAANIERTLDLHNYSECYLSYAYKLNSLENADNFYVQYYNGSSTITLNSYTNGDDDNAWHTVSNINLTPYGLSSLSKIIFREALSGSADYAWIDNVNVTCKYVEYLPGGDTVTSWVSYSDVTSGSYYSIINTTITLEASYYNPRGSIDNSSTWPDIELMVYGSSGWTSLGVFNLSSFYSGESSVKHNFSITITDQSLLKDWLNPNNRDIRVRGIYMDYLNDSSRDIINYTSIWVNITYTNDTTYSYVWTDTLNTGRYYVTDVYVNDTSNNINHSSYNNVYFDVINYGVPSINVHDVEQDIDEPYTFTNHTPTINFSVDVDSNCYVSINDYNYSQMVSDANAVNCGFFSANTFKTCTYSNTLSVGDQYLYISCNSTYGIENNNTNNKDLQLFILCDNHSDCAANYYCNYNGECVQDVLTGYNCEGLSFSGNPDNEVCLSNYCVLDTWDNVGYFCAKDSDDCVHDDNGNSYDLNYALCYNNDYYRICEPNHLWGDQVNCSKQFDPWNQSAVTHSNGYCGYYAEDQTCSSGDLDLGSYGCQGGSPTDCGPYIYLGSGVCGSTLNDCDVGCGAECDTNNNTDPELINNICYYDRSCSGSCLWSESQEIAPDYCINDFDGGPCAYSNRTDPSNLDICYWNPICNDSIGANLTSSGVLRKDYCDYCTATGNVSGDYSPAPNESCSSNCPNSGIIYYDSGGTPNDRSDDCNNGVTTIRIDSLSIGDVWDGSGPAYCDNTECDNDCGVYLTGVCLDSDTCYCNDTNPPEVSIVYPENNSWINTKDIDFQYYANDSGSGISNCSIYINDVLNQTDTSVNETDLNHFYVSFVNGTYNWSIECIDNSDNHLSTIKGKYFLGIDTTKPYLWDPNINGTSFKVNQKICLNISASDTYSGISSVTAIISSSGYPNDFVNLYDNGQGCDKYANDGVYSVDYTIIYDGVNTWSKAYAYDLAGNYYEISPSLSWSVATGGRLNTSLDNPTNDIEINEKEPNNSFILNCSTICIESYGNCEDVSIYPQYNYSGWIDINTTTNLLRSNVDSISCGNLTPYSDDWWNSSWQKRKPYTLYNPNNENLNEYQAILNLDTASLISNNSLRSDCNDIRVVEVAKIYELPINVSGIDTSKPVRITITDQEVLKHIVSRNSLRIYNESKSDPYSDPYNGLSFYVESFNVSELVLWVKVDSPTMIYLYYGDFNQEDVEDYSSVFNEFIGETGIVAVNSSWQWISFSNSYTEVPAVIASVITTNNASPVVVRISNVSINGFYAKLQPSPSSGSDHIFENVSWMALRKGVFYLGGKKLVVNTTAINNPSGNTYQTINLPTSFRSTPVVISSVNTYNEADEVHTREKSITTNSFAVKLEEETDTAHGLENVSWIAIEKGLIDMGDKWINSGEIQTTDSWKSIGLSRFSLGQLETENGGDNSFARLRPSNEGYEIHVEEEASYDGAHTTETLGFLNINDSSIDIYGVESFNDLSISNVDESLLYRDQKELSFYVDETHSYGCNSSNTWIWVKGFFSSNNVHTLYVYYDNPTANSESNSREVFSYDELTPIFYPVGSNNIDAADIIAFYNDTKISVNGWSNVLDQQETSVIPSGILSQNSGVAINKMVGIESQSTGDAFIPISFAGTMFVYRIDRGTNTYYFYAPFNDSRVEICYGTGFSTCTENITIAKGQVSQSTIDTPNDVTVRFNATNPVLIFHQGGSNDNFPLYPASNDWYGTGSNYLEIGILEDNTQITIYYSTGTSASYSKNAGDQLTIAAPSTSFGSNEGGDAAVHVVSNKPIGVDQHADSDGVETTTFLPEWELSNEYLIPQNAQYIAVTTVMNTTCTLYHSDGSSETQSVTTNYPYPGKIYFGSTTDGANIAAGSRLECDKPVMIYYEEASTNDEHNAWNVKQARKKAYKDLVIKSFDEQNSSETFRNNCTVGFVISSTLDSGLNNLSVRCRAYSSNSPLSISNNVSVYINDAPHAVISSPLNNSWINGVVIINASNSYDLDGLISTYTFMIDNNSLFSSPTILYSGSDSNVSLNTSNQDQCQEGNCYIRVIVVDDDGLNDSSWINVSIDNTPPVVYLDMPRNNENISGSSFIVNASVIDEGVGSIDIVVFDYRFNDSSPWINICNDSIAPYSCEWNLSGLSDGTQYQVRVMANDTLGNPSGYDIHTNITIDNTPPSITILSPENNVWVQSNATIVFNVSDNIGGIINCSLYINNVLNQSKSNVYGVNEFNVSFSSDGSYSYFIKCYDWLSNSNVSEQRVINVDNSGPLVSLLKPENYEEINSYSYELNSSITDEGIGNISFVLYEYRNNSNGVWVQACNVTNPVNEYNCSWDLSGLSDGTDYQVRVMANDTLGNPSGYSTHIGIKIDNQGPEISVIGPKNNSRDADGNIDFSFIVNDVASDISNCSLIFEGSINQTSTSIVEGEVQHFYIYNLSDGNYTWQIECWDNANIPHRSITDVYNLTVYIIYYEWLNLSTKHYWERDDIVKINVSALDINNDSLSNVNLTMDIVKGNATHKWWNTSWKYRKEIMLTETLGINRSSQWINIPVILDANCENHAYKESLVLTDENGTIIPVSIYNISYCPNTNYVKSLMIEFKTSINANSNALYYLYYDPSMVSSYYSLRPPIKLIWVSTGGSGNSPDYTTLKGEINTALNELGFASNIFDEQYTDAGSSDVSISDVINYSIVFYDSGQKWRYSMTTTECQNLEAVMLNSTNMFITGEDLGYDLDETLQCWKRLMHTDSGHTDNVGSQDMIRNGVHASTQFVSSSVSVTGSYLDGFNGTVGSFAKQILNWSTEPASSNVAGVANNGTEDSGCPGTPCGKTVFYAGIMLETGGEGIQDSTYRKNFYKGIIKWFMDTGINSSVNNEEEWIYRSYGLTDLNGREVMEWPTNSSHSYGNYTAVVSGWKTKYNNATSSISFELIPDGTPPIVHLNSPLNDSESNSSVTFTYIANDTLHEVVNCSLYIDDLYEDIDTDVQEGIVQFFYPRIPLGGWHNWTVKCFDDYGNLGVSETWWIYIRPPDLVINSGNITFSNPYPRENEKVDINATIYNLGGSDAYNVIVQFFNGDPSNGEQIGSNYSINLTDYQGGNYSETLNVSFITPGPGPFNIYVVVDPPIESNGSIVELNESNNIAYNTINVPGWQYYYGNMSGKVILANSGNQNFSRWIIINATGNIFITPGGVDIDWSQLQALGRDKYNNSEFNDFSEADQALNMTNYIDSISRMYTNGSDVRETQDIYIYGRLVRNIPIVNSTNNSNFKTGILWDMSDGGISYNGSQDIVMITKTNKGSQGSYGVYDFEIRVPVNLRTLHTNSDQVDLYYELG